MDSNVFVRDTDLAAFFDAHVGHKQVGDRGGGRFDIVARSPKAASRF